jgi:predicted outer membrane repeat protein
MQSVIEVKADSGELSVVGNGCEISGLASSESLFQFLVISPLSEGPSELKFLFSNCSVSGFGVPATTSGGFGGAVLAQAIHSVFLSHLLFTSNVAQQCGGAVFLESIVSIDLINCEFVNNLALGGGGIVLDSIHGGQINVVKTKFLNNSASSFGGGVLFWTHLRNVQFLDCTFIGNFAPSGGAIAFELNNTNIQIINSTFLSNLGLGSSGSGGAIFFGEDNSNVIIQGGLFDDNYAALGGVLVMQESNSNFTLSNCIFSHSMSNDEASVMRLSGSNILVTNCTFFGNTALTTEEYYGAVQLRGTRGIEFNWCFFEHNFPSAIHASEENRDLIIRNTNFLSIPTAFERAVVMEDTLTGTIERCLFQGGYSSSGSAIFAAIVGALIVSESQFISNEATWGGAVYSFAPMTLNNCLFLHNKANESGGALYHGSYTMYVNNCQFLENEARNFGGAIASTTHESLLVSGTVFENNLCLNDDGGAVYSMASYLLVITLSQFISNTANFGTGGVNVEGYHMFMKITNNTFVSNKSLGPGTGGLLIGSYNGDVQVTDCEFIENVGSDGGGINLGSGNENLDFLRLRFIGNVAGSTGGGMTIGSSNSDLNLIDCFFERNIAQTGGGLFVDSENVIKIINSTFVENDALLSGGGASFRSSNTIILHNSSFLQNLATEGGGFSVYSDNNLLFSYSQVTLNTATRKGGGLHLAFQNLENIFNHILFNSNTAQEGGGVYLQSGNANLMITNSTFSENSVSVNGGGIFIQDSNFDLEIKTCVFERNSARNYGGGVMLQSSNYRLTISSSLMTSNTAGLAGGSIHSSLYNLNLFIKDTKIWDSQSEYGGSIFIGNDHKIIRLENIVISRSLGSYGGGIYISAFSEIIHIINIQFLDCKATIHGAAIYSLADINLIDSCEITRGISETGIYLSLGILTTVTNCLFQNNLLPLDQYTVTSSGSLTIEDGGFIMIMNSTFQDNFAYFGGGVTVQVALSVIIQDCIFIRNRGILSGAIGIYSTNYMIVMNTNFIENSGDIGGALLINGWTITNFTNVIFDSNVGTLIGGALALYSSDTNFQDNSFTNNSAGFSGSAIYLDSSVTVLTNNNFSSNSVMYGGGAVYWLISSFMGEPYGLRNPLLNHFSKNIAPYGPNWATEGYALQTSSTMYNITTYGVPIPSLLVTFVDGYQQTVNTDSQTTIEVILSTSRTCNQLVGYATGGLTQVVSDGVANFSSIQVYCSPGSSLSLTFQVANDNHITSELIVLQFRSCVRGEYYSAQECVVCEVGTYSLSDNTGVELNDMDQISVCKTCPPHTITCHGDVLDLKKGFWRISVDSDWVQSCPYGTAACRGGEIAGDDSCATGYEGPLCAVCSPGYALKSSTKTCEACSVSSGLDISDMILLAVVCVILIGIAYFFTRPEIRSQIRSMDDFVLFVITQLRLADVSEGSNKKEVVAFANTLSRRLRARVKVYVTMYQILSALPFVLDLAFPSPVNLVISGLNFINISISNSAMVSCSTQSYDFIDSLLVDTIYPIVVVAILFSVRWIHISVLKLRNRSGSDSDSRLAFQIRLSNISSTYFTIFLVFTYLILPSVATKIFQTFRSAPSSSPPLCLTV